PQMGHNEAANPPRPAIEGSPEGEKMPMANLPHPAAKRILLEKFFQQCQDNFLILLKKEKYRHFL
ncbi:MAG: hypothetical protein ACE5L7_10925, partial [Candidatus Aminicenantales bacterium]